MTRSVHARLPASPNKMIKTTPFSDAEFSQLMGLLPEFFGSDIDPARISISSTNKFGFMAKTSHHLIRAEVAGRLRTVFCKTVPPNLESQIERKRASGFPGYDSEYNNLHYLCTLYEESEIPPFPKVVGLIQGQDRSFLLIEHFPGYRNLSLEMLALALPGRRSIASSLAMVRHVLERLFQLQDRCSSYQADVVYSELGVLESRLREINSLSSSEKTNLMQRARDRAAKIPRARVGLVHGDLGTRNILRLGDHVVFLDWEMAYRGGMSLYDACFFCISMLMRSVQNFVSQANITEMTQQCFDWIVELETQFSKNEDLGYSRMSAAFCWELAAVHLLHGVERKVTKGGFRSILLQRPRQLESLLSMIERGFQNEAR